mmetsp:Transcript_18043/g.44844  ORF Transcript_18043/g.44844 Transcript_18043/m.44844 type:complete len:81 (+) Transcript_18043:1327-1569(+)
MYIKKKTLNESAKKKTKGKIKHKKNQTILWIATDGSVEGNKKTVEKKEEERSLKKKGNHFELEQFQFSERQSEYGMGAIL